VCDFALGLSAVADERRLLERDHEDDSGNLVIDDMFVSGPNSGASSPANATPIVRERYQGPICLISDYFFLYFTTLPRGLCCVCNVVARRLLSILLITVFRTTDRNSKILL